MLIPATGRGDGQVLRQSDRGREDLEEIDGFTCLVLWSYQFIRCTFFITVWHTPGDVVHRATSLEGGRGHAL
jgi:hypothetical protein